MYIIQRTPSSEDFEAQVTIIIFFIYQNAKSTVKFVGSYYWVFFRA